MTNQVPNKTIDNASGQVVRLDIESTLKATAANNFGPLSSGGELLPCEFFAQSDQNKKLFIRGTTGGNLAQRNVTDSATLFEVGNLDQANLGLLPKAGGIMTGQLQGDDASVAGSPAFCFDGDTDTGMYRQGANIIGFSTAGTQKLQVDSTGLTIFGDSSSARSLVLREASNNGTNAVTIKALDSLGSNYTLTLPPNDGNNGQFLQTNGSGVLTFATVTGFSGAGSDLTGSSLASGITSSSLTSVGTLTGLSVNGNVSVTQTATAATLSATNVSGTNVKGTNFQDTGGNNGSTAVQIQQGRAKAWVNFNGTGTVAIRDDYNVSSITDHAAGQYTVNLDSGAVANSNYSVSMSMESNNNALSTAARPLIQAGPSGNRQFNTSGFRICASNVATQSSSDPKTFCAIVFGD